MKRRPKQTEIVAAVVIALVGAYLVLGGGSSEAATAAPPDDGGFEEVGVFVQEEPLDDGLNRFLIEVPAAETVDGSQSTETETQTAAPDADSGDAAAAEADYGVAHLWVDSSGAMWARYPSGQDIAVSGNDAMTLDSHILAGEPPETPAPENTASEPADRVTDDLLAELRSDANIIEARRVDDDTVSVVTTYESAELSELLSLVVLTDERLAAFATDPYFVYQWGLENTGQDSGYVDDADIDVTGAWTSSSGGDGVIVAVLDSGVDFGHPDLTGAQWTNAGENCSNGVDDDNNGYVDDCGGWDFINNDNTPWDGNNHYHGTHVSGIVAARSDTVGIVGVAPNATIMDVRVLDTQGSGLSSGFAAGIRYAVDNGAKIINMSLGTQPGVPRAVFGSVEQAVQYARDQGVILVAAAGNSGVDIDASPVWPASYAPYYDNVLAVASTDYADARSSFSNYGQGTVTLAAPGSRILSTMPGASWSYASGTSMASPMVAGGLALVLGDVPASTPVETRNRAVDNIDPLGSLTGLIVNPGRLNVANIYSQSLVPPVHLEASGLAALSSSQPIAAQLHLTINDTAAFVGRDFRWQARLLTEVDGAAYGVLDHDVIVDGVATRSDSAALVSLSGATSLTAEPTLASSGVYIDVATALPAGSYALIVEAVAQDGLAAISAPPNVLFFSVGDQAPVTTTTVVSPVPGVTSTTVVSPVPGVTSTTVAGPVTTSVPVTTSPVSAPAPTSTPTTSVGSPTTLPVSGPSPVTTTTVVSPVPGVTSTTVAGPVTTSVPVTTSPVSGPSPVTTTTVVSPVPGVTSTTVVVPVTTSAPTTTSTTMAPVQNGQWSIDFISPGQAYVPSAGLVSVYGSFPADSFVWFGDSAATPVFSSSNFLLVMLPRITTPGTVDVSLRTASQTVLVAPSAFRFLEPDVVTTPPTSGPGSVTTTTIQGVTPTTAPGGVTTTTVLGVTPTSGPGGVTTTTVLGVSTTMAPGGVTTTTTQGATPTPVQFQFGTPLVLGNGLRVSPLTQPAAPTGAVSVANWSTRSCSTTMCQSTRL